MPRQLFTVEDTSFVVMVDNTLTSLDQKVLTHLYQPIIGNKAIYLFQTLHTVIENSLRESEVINHHQILSITNLSPKEFVEERIKLEAVGLLDTYFKDNIYVYVLKRVLTSYEFFDNFELTHILEANVGSEVYQKLSLEFQIRKLDLNNLNHITSHFDEVFSAVKKEEVKNIGIDTTNHGIVVDNTKFSLENYLMLVKSMDLVNQTVLDDFKFLDLISRLAFLFNLDEAAMKEATFLATLTDGTVNIDDLKYQVKRIYDSKKSGIVFKPRSEVVHSNDRSIYYLETLTPNEVCQNVTNTSLTSAEIEMFNQILDETGIQIGVLNATLLYVLNLKNGEIPSINYFLKIIVQMQRAGVTDASSAVKYLNRDVKSQKTKSKVSKKVVDTPDWYKTKNEQNNKKTSNEKEIENISDFFKDDK